MIYLRQSTASQEVPLGVFVDETDGFTAETALAIANTDIKVWKSGATTLANKNSGGATHISGGIYYAVFDATATITYALKDATGTTLTGGTGSYSYTAASNGDYTATIESTVTALETAGSEYWLEVTISSGSYNDFRRLKRVAEYRGDT